MVAALGAIGAALLTSGAEAGPPPEAVKAGYTHVVFSDDFSNLDLSPDGGGSHRWYNTLWMRGQVNPNKFHQMDGFVRLETEVEPRKIVQTTAITTMPRKPGTETLFHYGYFEARMRYQPGPYAWPAFWLLAKDRIGFDEAVGKGEWCEIDIFEGGRPKYFQGTVHHWLDFKSTTNQNAHFALPAETNPGDWNTYGVLWTRQTISWFFNGKLLGSAPTPAICRKQKMFMIIGSQKRSMGPSPEVLDVDWVRVYR